MAKTKTSVADELDLEDLLSAREELELLAQSYQVADVQEKGAKKEKETLRGPFLDLMSEVVRDEIPLGRVNETVTDEELAAYGGDFENWRARNFPEWTIVGVAHEEGRAIVTLEENDAFKKFEFSVGGFKFGRTFKMVDSNFEAERYANEVPKLDDIPRDVLKKLIDCVTSKTIVTYALDETKAEEVMADHPETLRIFQEYLDPGKPQVALLPIRKVKEDEE